MTTSNRREFLKASLAGSMGGLSLASLNAEALAVEQAGGNLHLAPFKFDVTPPMGHSLCGGWIKPVVGVDDPLEAIGFVLTGLDKPVVICAVDWTGLLNDAHVQWRTALAEAAGTTPDRVAVQCVHQHNAPFACLDAERIVLAQGDLPHIVELDFYNTCLDRAREAVTAGLKKARPVTHVAHGEGRVHNVASNRRIYRSPEGTIKAMRGSSCKDEKLRSMQDGVIDPWLKTVAFYDRDTKVAACHYYSTHPMSYYGDGQVSSDFAGLARKQRQVDEPNCLHLYFTGCAGNISAGKYNDGSHEMRPILAKRIYDGIVESESRLRPEPIGSIGWKTQPILPPPRAGLSAEEILTQIEDKSNSVVNRNRPSYAVAWLRRLEQQVPIILSALHVNDTALVHLPSECFIEYQLRTQMAAPSKFVAVAAYGDGGPWYIPNREAYPQGGYEVSVALCEPEVDPMIMGGVRNLLG